MLPRPQTNRRPDCDGCGVRARRALPQGWFARTVDPPYYVGPRRLLFCPRCFDELPSSQQPRWRRLGAPAAAPRLVMIARRLVHFPTPRRRGLIG
jgi:hypothetical protein